MRKCNPNYWRALWPAFLVAIPGVLLLISAIDPHDVALFGDVVLSRSALYTLGFIVLWLLCWASSALNLWLFGGRAEPSED